MKQMKTMNKYIVLLLVSCLAFSCKDAYDDHYDSVTAGGTQSLKELIAENKDLSAFAQLITIAGLDSVFSSNQTYTVWAPTNEALSDINLASVDKEQARLIVENHIARYNNSTATPDNKLIRMRDKKTFYFTAGGTVFGGAKLLQHDILAKNGILHTLQSQIPYYYNLYEYIQSNANTSKLAAFISSFEENVFNEEASTVIDINESGQTVYDTITTPYNRLFDANFFFGLVNLGIGHINEEDSLYTMLVPTNTAWDAAYQRIAPYFKTVGNKADSLQNQQTSLAILDDLVYRGVIEAPASQDYLVSTSPDYAGNYSTIINHPAELFGGSEKIQASNGLVFLTNTLNYNNTETWNKWLMVEADDTQGRVLSANTTITTRTVDDNFGAPVSEYRYIYVEGSTPSAQPGVTFEIPQVLSGAYNIYVEFLPLYLDTQGQAGDKTKLLFELSYMDTNGKLSTKLVNAANLVTSDTEPVWLKVFDNFTFPMSNFYDRLWWIDYYKGLHTWEDRVVTTKLLVKTNVSNAEFNSHTYVRKFCVDRIIFEPIQK
jgi:uncharacterized surface protein with fasciclin (FAS1) repeats